MAERISGRKRKSKSKALISGEGRSRIAALAGEGGSGEATDGRRTAASDVRRPHLIAVSDRGRGRDDTGRDEQWASGIK